MPLAGKVAAGATATQLYENRVDAVGWQSPDREFHARFPVKKAFKTCFFAVSRPDQVLAGNFGPRERIGSLSPSTCAVRYRGIMEFAVPISLSGADGLALSKSNLLGLDTDLA
ncbi:hypothetical protein K239x_51840 [Planctomycetes bacterium K23_9]|uniref:Uncharacterized protein n=1 Tax=Stieleria marina TaxID=1930275 RepID=A0A517P1B5_9BACT|nr:hypothetical protein K239x_51840 [Planctomycetes bacterium K23_9]